MALYHFTLKDNKTPDERVILASDHAEYNHREGKYANLDQNRARHISGADHVDYIARQEKYSQKEGFVCGGQHLPVWAKHSPKVFFQAADAYEASVHTYKELEFSLQSELTLDQNLALVQEFISKHFGTDYYYAYAIHNKLAAMGAGEKNQHCHLMFSPRKLDALEKEEERQPSCFFQKARRLYTRRDGSIIDRRREGGCAVPSIWNKQVEGRNHLLYLREEFAKITNSTLEKHGHEIRIDHRSHRVRRQEAVQKGDALTERLFSLEPEKHIGPTIANIPDHPLVIALKERRALRKELCQLIEAANRLQKLQIYKNEKKSKERLEQKVRHWSNTDSDGFPSSSSDIAAAQRATNIAHQQIRHWGDHLASLHLARMSQQEKAALQRIKELHRDSHTLSLVLEAVREKYDEEKNQLLILQQQPNKTRSQQLAYCESALAVLQLNEEESLLSQARKDCTEKAKQSAQMLRSISPLLHKKEIIFQASHTYLQQVPNFEAFEQAVLTELPLLKEKLKQQAETLSEMKKQYLTYPQAIRKAQEEYIKTLNDPVFLRVWQRNTQFSENIFLLKRAQKDIVSCLTKVSSPQETTALLAEQERLQIIAKTNASEQKKQRITLQELRRKIHTPSAKSYITRKANALLLTQKPQQDAYCRMQDELSKTTDRIRRLTHLRVKLMNEIILVKTKFSSLPITEQPQDQFYTAREIQGILRTAIYSLRAEQQSIAKEIETLRPFYISEKHAKTIALYHLSEGKLQVLQELKKKLSISECEQRSTDDSLLSHEYTLTMMPVPKWYDKILNTQTQQHYLGAQEAAQKQKMQAFTAAHAHTAIKERIIALEKEIEQLTATPQAKEKLSIITAGILKKNQFTGDKMQNLLNRQSELKTQEKEMLHLLTATEKQVFADQSQSIRYSAPGNSTSAHAISLIARSFASESTACAAVVKIINGDHCELDTLAQTVAECEETKRKAAWAHNEF